MEGTKPRDIVGLDPAGLEGLSDNLLALLAERGMDPLPEACRHERCGDRFHQFLERKPIWQKLMKEVASTPSTDGSGQALVPYSLRHGYALRAHEVYGLSPRVAAAVLGHSLQTHSAVYGVWTDREVIEGALAKAKKVRALLAEKPTRRDGKPA